MTQYYEQLNLMENTLSLLVKMDQNQKDDYKVLEKTYENIEIHISEMDVTSFQRITKHCKNKLIVIANKQLLLESLNEMASIGMIESIKPLYDEIKLTISMKLINEGIIENNLKMMQQFHENEMFSNTEYMMIKSLLIDAKNQMSKLKSENLQLQKQNEAIQKQIDQGIFDSKSEQFQTLMEKYKTSNERLNNLRNSRLGKLQIKYWDYKGR